jgi:hypothetical protein
MSVERKGLAMYEQALQALQALQAHPKFSMYLWRSIGSAHFDLGDELFERGDHAAAMAQYQTTSEVFAKSLVDTNDFQARLDSAKVTHRIASVLLAMGTLKKLRRAMQRDWRCCARWRPKATTVLSTQNYCIKRSVSFLTTT